MKKEGTPTVCYVCGVEFYLPPSSRLEKNACSRACRAKAQSEWQRKDLQERFWAKVEKTDHCWNWVGAITGNGYGSIRVARKSLRAPRVSYELCNGPIPPEMIIRHTCDNPKCVNPAHLIAGTKAENTDDALRRGQHLVGDKHPRAKLTNNDVAAILAELDAGMQGRDISKKYDVDETLISKIKLGKKRRFG